MIVAVTHGYPGRSGWNMGGEVSLHRTLAALGEPVTVLTRTDEPYTLDGINVRAIDIDDVLNVDANPAPLVWQLARLNASLVIAQNELSGPAVKAAHALGIPSVVSIHTPPRYGRHLRESVRLATAAIFNTQQAATEWRHPKAFVLHPPITDLPAAPKTPPRGTHYTLLSNLANKGVGVVLNLAAQLPDRKFLIVRSPAETTHGIENFDERAAALPNVTVAPRVAPEEVANAYLSKTRILLAPSRYETYGMSALEAGGYGIPAVHVDTPHVREGIGEAAALIPPLDTDATLAAINAIEADYAAWSQAARNRAEAVAARQADELAALPGWINDVRRNSSRQRA